MFSWADLTGGRTAATILGDILDGLKALATPFPVDDWEEGGVVRTLLQVGFAPAVSRVWDAIATITKGGLLRLAQQLAEADPQAWASNAQGSWLYLLASKFYGIEIKAAQFARGTEQFTNNGSRAYQITSSHVVSTPTGLRYTVDVAAPVPLPAGATVFVPIKAESPGIGYNVAAGAITVLNVSMPGVTVSNQPQPPATSWVTTSGTDQESPKELADRCALRWGRITQLQTAPADGWKSLALDAANAVRKVAVWSNFNPDLPPPGFEAQSVTYFLGAETGPADPASVAAVDAAARPYIGVCDKLYTRPCGAATLTLAGTIYCTDSALVPQVQAAVEAAFIQLESDLDIGELVRAWRIEKTVDVPGVQDFVPVGLVDFIPARNARVQIDYTHLVYQGPH